MGNSLENYNDLLTAARAQGVHHTEESVLDP